MDSPRDYRYSVDNDASYRNSTYLYPCDAVNDEEIKRIFFELSRNELVKEG